MIATSLVVAANAASVAALRAVASAGFTANTVATALVSAGNRAYYRWTPASTATDDALSVIKPTDISVGNPGRWLIRDWVETSTEGFYSGLLFSVDLGATASAASYAFEIGNDWEFSCLTIEGSNRRAWFKKRTQ